MTEISNIPIFIDDKRVGTGYTRNESLVILWDADLSETFKELAVTGLMLGIKLNPIFSPANPKIH